MESKFSDLTAFFDQINWTEIFSNFSEVDEMYNSFLDILYFAFENFVPKFIPRKKNSIWSRETKIARRKKDRLHLKYKQSGLQRDLNAYKEAARLSQRLARQDICTHERKILESRNTKRFWKYINSKLRVRPHIPTLKDGQNSVAEARGKAELLNKYFASVFTVDDGLSPEPHRYEVGKSLDRITFFPHEVLRILKDCVLTRLCGPDNVPAIILKHCAESLCEPLASIFNVSFYTQKIPQYLGLCSSDRYL